jgi:porphobilinogen synthase
MSQRFTTLGKFPTTRLRRNRRHAWSRRLVAETKLSVDDLIWPVFVQEGKKRRTAIASMPGVFRFNIDELVQAVGEAKELGVPAVAIFPEVDAKLKTPDCREAYNGDNLVCRAVAAVKKAHPDIGVICDVALDPFNSLGHDGIVRGGYVVNDESVDVMTRQALVQAEAGADIQAPSDMMDGRIGAFRKALDEAGYEHVQIMSYAAKYASAFYGPFRDAIGSKGALGKGDKKTYQMDYANSDEALREVGFDIAEGADCWPKPSVDAGQQKRPPLQAAFFMSLELAQSSSRLRPPMPPATAAMKAPIINDNAVAMAKVAAALRAASAACLALTIVSSMRLPASSSLMPARAATSLAR